MKFQFIVTNIVNDKLIATLRSIKESDIELAVKLHQISTEEIGITVEEIWK